MSELPNHFDAEVTVLGHLLMENKLFYMMSFLQAEHFHEPVHQRIFKAIEQQIVRGEGANHITLRDFFQKDQSLADIGGAVYLVKLTKYAEPQFNPIETARLVVAIAHKRMLISACNEALAKSEDDPSLGFEELAATINSKIESISAESAAKRVRDDFEVTTTIIDNLKTRRDPFSTGLKKLDLAMGGGLFPGRSYGFAARKKVGKTVLASTISYNLNNLGHKHLFIAAEMGANEIHERNLARAINRYPSDFRGIHRDEPEFVQRIADASVQSKRCILYQDAPGLTFDDLRRYIAGAVYRNKITGVILDYWQLVGGKAKNASTSEHLDEVAQWIADFCRKHNLWSITMAQINQEGNTRGGEGIRLAFDQVYQIHRKDVSKPAVWLEMMDTRYTKWLNVGDEDTAGFLMEDKGPYFREPDRTPTYSAVKAS